MKSVKYLEAVREKYGLKTNAALALKLGKSEPAVHQYLKGGRVMDNETCLAVSMALEFDEHQTMQVIMAADIDRAEKAGQESLWTVFSKRMAATAASALLVAGVSLFLTPENAEARTYSPTSTVASQAIYVM
ncbi:Cro/Cl family transcriptional regulator [Pseudoduganella sp. FT25W]|uniref:Cro/Cl family transcriptional regulator n=1 Tax=Duganella alba TaxID=2666081 RepID=A0A6L5Q9W0_9BURK|nr:Cro/Cl family transcriptional regulator [Duganella alba]MRX06485.1 Cro/Cl family transcriptional regulator [Duganella alba]MRX14879.1 Cro/Cl family transcriptional regulator [Duganella alba]